MSQQSKLGFVLLVSAVLLGVFFAHGVPQPAPDFSPGAPGLAVFETRADASGCHGTAVVLRGFNLRQTSLVPQVRVPRLDANLGREGRNEPQVSPNEGRTRDTH
jgi:hypothetical protein